MGSRSISMKLILLLLTTLTFAMASWPSKLHPDGSVRDTGVPATFDCAMRKLAYKYGKQLIPRMGSFESLYYALDLNDPSCQSQLPTSPQSATQEPVLTAPSNGLFVAPHSGSDSAEGSVTSPLRTVQAA